jgi:transcriptional regulator with XRE-family HTH domain
MDFELTTNTGQKTHQRTAQDIRQDIREMLRHIIAVETDLKITQKTQQEIRQQVNDLINQGAIEKLPDAFACPDCGAVMGPQQPFCTSCNWRHDQDEGEDEGGDEKKDSPPDEDLIDVDDSPRSEEDKRTGDFDIRRETGVHEALTAFLKKEGFSEDEAVIGASLFAYVTGTVSQWDIETVKKTGTELINSHFDEAGKYNALQIWDKIVTLQDIKKFISLFKVINEARELEFQEESMISIQRVGEDFRVIVKNPYENMNVTDLKYKKEGVSTEFWLSRLQNMHETLQKIGNALLRKRIDFFEAGDKNDAEKILQEKPLTQKDLAEEAGVHPSTISRQKNGWARFIDTPWGIKNLQDFFEIPSGAKEDTRVSYVNEIIEEIIEKYKDKGLIVTSDVIKKDLEKVGIFHSERTIRHKRQKSDSQNEGENNSSTTPSQQEEETESDTTLPDIEELKKKLEKLESEDDPS